jgi:exodeoxyribonuclease-5
LLVHHRESRQRWSPQQDQALARVRDWLRNSTAIQQVFHLFGYAGTGKTELAKEIGGSTPLTKFAAFTGKAAFVLRQRGCSPCSTIHRLIYNVHYDEVRRRYYYRLKPREDLVTTRLIIVDECSMVNNRLAEDLLSFDIPVLVVGDPAQLPPVHGSGYFMSGRPDAMLTEIHRQALDNPILRLANKVRGGGRLPPVGYRAGDLRISHHAEREEFDTVLVGRNSTRHDENARLRMLHGFCSSRSRARKTEPQPGETVVCLANDYGVLEPVWNGSQWTISSLEHDLVEGAGDDGDDLPIAKMKIRDRWNGSSTVRVPLECFGADEVQHYHGLGLQQFDYGYALTVHKAQGSEWPDVLLINEAQCFRDRANRWLYTAITRAIRRLTILDYS